MVDLFVGSTFVLGLCFLFYWLIIRPSWKTYDEEWDRIEKGLEKQAWENYMKEIEEQQRMRKMVEAHKATFAKIHPLSPDYDPAYIQEAMRRAQRANLNRVLSGEFLKEIPTMQVPEIGSKWREKGTDNVIVVENNMFGQITWKGHCCLSPDVFFNIFEPCSSFPAIGSKWKFKGSSRVFIVEKTRRELVWGRIGSVSAVIPYDDFFNQVEEIPTMRFKEGDVITDNRQEYTVKAALPDLGGYVVESIYSWDKFFQSELALKKFDYVNKEKHLTVAEIESKLGYEPGTLRIKK